MTAAPTTELAAYESVWLIHLRALGAEVSRSLRLIGLLCSDKATKRAIVDGDEAARNEVVRAFAALSLLHEQFAQTLQPPPKRFAEAGDLWARAFAALRAAAEEFERSAGPVIDFDGLARVGGHIAKAAKLVDALTPTGSQPDA